MCLGAQARAANKRARRDYEYSLQRREADWMQTLSITNTERVMYDQGIDASNLGLANVYSDIEKGFGDAVGKVLQQDEVNWKKFLQDNEGMKMAAKGQIGRSADRVSTLDFADYLKKGSRKAYELTELRGQLDKQAAAAAGQARAEQLNLFARNSIIKNPDIAPPKPVMQNVGMAAFKDALSIANTVASIAAIPATGGASGATLGGKFFETAGKGWNYLFKKKELK